MDTYTSCTSDANMGRRPFYAQTGIGVMPAAASPARAQALRYVDHGQGGVSMYTRF